MEFEHVIGSITSKKKMELPGNVSEGNLTGKGSPVRRIVIVMETKEEPLTTASGIGNCLIGGSQLGRWCRHRDLSSGVVHFC
jgi:hypothetical protein